MQTFRGPFVDQHPRVGGVQPGGGGNTKQFTNCDVCPENTGLIRKCIDCNNLYRVQIASRPFSVCLPYYAPPMNQHFALQRLFVRCISTLLSVGVCNTSGLEVKQFNGCYLLVGGWVC